MNKTLVEEALGDIGQQSYSEAGLQPEGMTDKFPNASLKVSKAEQNAQKFLELRKRREDLSQLSQFKLSMIDHKTATKALKKFSNKDSNQKKTSTKDSESCEKKWEEVRQYFDINAHLTGSIGHGIREPKSGLEEKINAEVKVGNFDKAEELSNVLAERELAVRIDDAFGAKRYAEAENVKKETMMRKRQKRIPWGFETKERWEMKGNM